MKRSDVAARPELRWNAFIEVMLDEYDDLSDLQRVAHLALRYDGEVQNGGHLQYFLNSGGERNAETVLALKALGANRQAAILEQALARWNLSPLPEIEAVEDYLDAQRVGEFSDLDSAYYDLEPQLGSFLETFLEEHEDQFIAYV